MVHLAAVRKLAVCFILMLGTGLPCYLSLILPESTKAASLTELEQRKKEADARAKKAAEQAEQQKKLAEQAAAKVQEVSSQLTQLEGSIGQTEQTISSTEQQIGTKGQEIALLESELRRIQDQQDELVRRLFMMKASMPGTFAIFSNESISEREHEEAQFTALKNSVTNLYSQTVAKKMEVEQQRQTLAKKNDELKQLQNQQTEQRRGLAQVREVQADLKSDALAATEKLENEAEKARRETSRLEVQIQQELTRIINARKSSSSFGDVSRDGRGVGKRVSRGDFVGHLGSTGYSTGPHVHFEVRVNNSPTNPSPYVSNGTLSWPVNNFRITQGFGYTDYARSGAYGGSMHTGIDLAGPYGQPVFAPADGVVIMNQYYGGYGYAWAMQLDNGLVVLLGHMTGS